MQIKPIYTIGHSTLSLQDFIATLHAFSVQVLVDVRSLPGSRYVPQFNKENLQTVLPRHNIEYVHFAQLGGRRKSSKESDFRLVEGWQNKSFRNYASYTLTDNYAQGINLLMTLAKQKTACVMCAELVPWKCHRSIISNTLTNKGYEVYHITGKDKCTLHKLNSYGAQSVQKGDKLIYPKLEKTI